MQGRGKISLGLLASQNDKVKARALSQASLRLSNIGEKQAALRGYLAPLHVHINPTLAAGVFALRSLLGDAGSRRTAARITCGAIFSWPIFRSCYFPTDDVAARPREVILISSIGTFSIVPSRVESLSQRLAWLPSIHRSSLEDKSVTPSAYQAVVERSATEARQD